MNQLGDKSTILDTLYTIVKAISNDLPDVPELNLIATEATQTVQKLDQYLDREGNFWSIFPKRAHSHEDKKKLLDKLEILIKRLESVRALLALNGLRPRPCRICF